MVYYARLSSTHLPHQCCQFNFLRHQLAFVNHWDIGWYDDGGVWHPECDFVFENIGSAALSNWDKQAQIRLTTVNGASGTKCWKIRLAVPTDLVFRPLILLFLNDSGSAFDLKWTRHNLRKCAPLIAVGGVAHSFGKMAVCLRFLEPVKTITLTSS